MSLAEQAAALGIDESEIAEFVGDDDTERVCRIDEENWESVMVFLGCATQWRRILPPMGGALIYEGLIYSGVSAVIDAYGHAGKRASEIFQDVQIMEAAALAKLQQQAS